jgi:hypothetical protein
MRRVDLRVRNGGSAVLEVVDRETHDDVVQEDLVATPLRRMADADGHREHTFPWAVKH